MNAGGLWWPPDGIHLFGKFPLKKIPLPPHHGARWAHTQQQLRAPLFIWGGNWVCNRKKNARESILQHQWQENRMLNGLFDIDNRLGSAENDTSPVPDWTCCKRACRKKRGRIRLSSFAFFFLWQLNFPSNRWHPILIVSVLGKNVSGDFGMIPAVKQCLEWI